MYLYFNAMYFLLLCRYIASQTKLPYACIAARTTLFTRSETDHPYNVEDLLMFAISKLSGAGL